MTITESDYQVSAGENPSLTLGTLALLSLTAALSVASIYYNQPILAVLANEFSVSPGKIALIPVLSQAGYACGIFFLSPLGDRYERKKLILLTTSGLIISLLSTAIAQNILWLSISSFATGILATVTQQIVPLTVHLSAPKERGKTIGIITGAILLGILLARTFGGFLTDMLGWRSVYWIASALMIFVATLMAIRLPKVKPTTDINYIEILRSLRKLFIKYPALRKASLIQLLVFGSFLAFWSTLAQLFEQPQYALGATAVGLVALVGAGGALMAPIAGKLSDKRGPGTVITVSTIFLFIAFVLLATFQNSLISLIVSVIIMDLSVQASQVSNQSLVYALDENARSRLNTVFMTAMFVGGSLGSALGNIAFEYFNWTGTCIIATLASLIAFLISIRYSSKNK